MKWTELMAYLAKDFRKSEAEIASLCGITYPTLNRIRNGKTLHPTQSTISALEKGLNIKIDDSDPDNITFTRVNAGAVADSSIIKEDQVKYLSEEEVQEYIDLTDEIIANMKQQLEELEKRQKEIKQKQQGKQKGYSLAR